MTTTSTTLIETFPLRGMPKTLRLKCTTCGRSQKADNDGWYEHTDGTWGRYYWGTVGSVRAPKLNVTLPSPPPAGAIAYKYADTTEDARFVTERADAQEIHSADPNLLVWLDLGAEDDVAGQRA